MSLPTPIPAAIHVLLALWLIAIAVLLVLCLSLLHLYHNWQRRRAGQPQRSLAGHVRRYAVQHVAAALVLAAGVLILAGVGVR